MGAYQEVELNSLHEAGHAVATVAMGGQVERVTPDTCLQAGESPLKPWDAAVVCMAGGVAARMIGPKYRSLSREPSEQDLAVAESHLAKVGLGPDDIPRAERAARQLLLDHKRAVERVAQALRATGELTGHQVVRLFLGERVDAVVGDGLRGRGDATPEPVPAPTRTATEGAPMCVRAFTFPLQERWIAAVFDPQDDGLKCVHVPDCEGESEDEAIDALGNSILEKTGAPVSLDVVSTEGTE